MSLKHVEGKVIIRCDLEGKNWWTFANGQKIRYERQFNNLNRRETEPVNAIVVSAEGIPEGTEILIHPNAVDESNRIYNYKQLSGEVLAGDIRYYSIKPHQCFIYKDEADGWKPLPPYETALRVFKPYNGPIQGIEPELIKNCLWVTSGNLKGSAVKTIMASDYEIVFQDTNGKEGRIIRFRPNGDEYEDREPEAVCLLPEITKKIKKGEYFVGLSTSDAKPLKELVYG